MRVLYMRNTLVSSTTVYGKFAMHCTLRSFNHVMTDSPARHKSKHIPWYTERNLSISGYIKTVPS